MVTAISFVYFSHDIKGFLGSEATKVRTGMKVAVKLVIDKGEHCAFDPYLSCLELVGWKIAMLQVLDDGSHP